MLDKLAVTLQCDTYVPKRVCKLCCADPRLGTPYSNLTEIKMKKCRQCLIDKEESCFSKMKDSLDGLQRRCKDCNRKYRELNKNKISEAKKKCYLRDKEKYKNRIQTAYFENREDRLLYAKNYRESNGLEVSTTKRKCYDSNPSLYTFLRAKYRASKLKATPPWLTKQDFEQIKELYEVTKAFRLYTGEEYHVDHIVPLQGENVCGLHVPWNLQVISAKENLSKHNKLIQE